jgi:hypothetical protein
MHIIARLRQLHMCRNSMHTHSALYLDWCTECAHKMWVCVFCLCICQISMLSQTEASECDIIASYHDGLRGNMLYIK